jgi:hypothetical protein
MSSKAFTAKTFAWLRQINHGRYLAIDLKVALQLTEHFNEKDQEGRAYPSYKTIADAIGVSEQTVIRSVERMRAQGDLYVIPGKPGRGYPNQYWMVVKPVQKTSKVAEVFPGQKKPPSGGQKTSIAVEENHLKNHQDTGWGVLRTPPSSGRENALTCESIPSIGGGPLDAAADLFGQQAERAEIKTETEPEARKRTPGGERAEGVEIHPPAVIVGRESSGHWRELRSIWERGWASDDTPQAIAIARNAFARACRDGAEADDILDGARVWVAAADAPRFLPALPTWLAAKGWETPPPTKRGRRANGHKAQRSNGYAKPDMFKIVLEAGGFREDADGKLYWPGDGAGDDEPLCTSMWRAGS